MSSTTTERYCRQWHKYNNRVNTIKQDYFKDKSATSTKELFKVCNILLNLKNTNILPTHTCGTELANRSVNYLATR